MAARPKYRFLVKSEGSDEWKELGAAWSLTNSESCSAKITSPNGETFKFLLVENKPKVPGPRIVPPSDHRPAA